MGQGQKAEVQMKIAEITNEIYPPLRPSSNGFDPLPSNKLDPVKIKDALSVPFSLFAGKVTGETDPHLLVYLLRGCYDILGYPSIGICLCSATFLQIYSAFEWSPNSRITCSGFCSPRRRPPPTQFSPSPQADFACLPTPSWI